MEAYLDNSATTRCSERAKNVMMQVLTEDYGNPSSLHNKGKEAEDYIREAREKIARTLKIDEKELVFTSGGTESNNMALIGGAIANKRQGMHIITTAIEHASVNAPLAYLEELGYTVTYLSVDKDGLISLDELRDAVREDTVLVSVMMVNNEIGAVEPIEEAVKIVKEKNPNTLFHVDAIQAYGKFRIYPKKWGVDLMSVSGHKIHAPKGTGFLFIRDKVKVKPLIYGGGQQKGMRSGTENVPGVAALGEASAEIYEDFETKIDRMYALKERFIEGVTQIEGVTVNGRTGRDSAPQIVSVSIKDVRSEVMLHSLEEYGIYVSAGSACSSNKPAPSRTLQGIGLAKNQLESTIRISFCVNTTEEEVDYAVEKMREIIPFRRKFTRK
ncbi:MAG: cysteine desulfurase family protein [Clostridiales bacterium]|nr:cysteine desulfurase [Roseburia sp.]MDD7635534.1 cysteine desulfurase family protein [Clostridiales bacterium]MDY4111496.1 cysteine desulfurase family protein [Roseburia sp.]